MAVGQDGYSSPNESGANGGSGVKSPGGSMVSPTNTSVGTPEPGPAGRWFCGGGGGGAGANPPGNNGAGGNGGGGDGALSPGSGEAGATNCGSGGGGRGGSGGNANSGGTGGSGTVILRYKIVSGQPT